MKNLQIIQRPAVTEKSTDQQARGKYVVIVSPDATKIDVEKAFESLYGVEVSKVNMLKSRPKFRSAGKRGNPIQKRKQTKRAIVTIKGKKEVNLLKPKLKK